MAKQSQIFNQFLGEVSDLTDALHNVCEKYSGMWEDNMPLDDIAAIIKLGDRQNRNPPEKGE